MASITIRNLPDETEAAMRARATEQGLSLEAYVRNLLLNFTMEEERDTVKLTDLARKYFGPKGGVDLELPSRRTHREVLEFDR